MESIKKDIVDVRSNNEALSKVIKDKEKALEFQKMKTKQQEIWIKNTGFKALISQTNQNEIEQKNTNEDERLKKLQISIIEMLEKENALAFEFLDCENEIYAAKEKFRIASLKTEEINQENLKLEEEINRKNTFLIENSKKLEELEDFNKVYKANIKNLIEKNENLSKKILESEQILNSKQLLSKRNQIEIEKLKALNIEKTEEKMAEIHENWKTKVEEIKELQKEKLWELNKIQGFLVENNKDNDLEEVFFEKERGTKEKPKISVAGLRFQKQSLVNQLLKLSHESKIYKNRLQQTIIQCHQPLVLWTIKDNAKWIFFGFVAGIALMVLYKFVLNTANAEVL